MIITTLLESKLMAKAAKMGLKLGKKAAVKIEEKTHIVEKADAHRKEIVVAGALLTTGLVVGYTLGSKKRRKSIFARIAKKRKQMKRKAQRDMLIKGASIIIKNAMKKN